MFGLFKLFLFPNRPKRTRPLFHFFVPIFPQEIDGKALLLLTREMIMSYMGLKLGPAIKLLDIIEELKLRKVTS